MELVIILIKYIYMKLTNISQEVDSNGAGDLFFASTIKDYLNNNLIFDASFNYYH
jgi:sugar/nucleoside kinase (ribokinase family)